MAEVVLFSLLMILTGASVCYALVRYNGVLGFFAAVVPGFLLFTGTLSTYCGALYVQLVALLVIGLVALVCRARFSRFLLAASIASLVVVAMAAASGLQKWSALAVEYPVESLAGRLAYETAERPLPQQADDQPAAPADELAGERRH